MYFVKYGDKYLHDPRVEKYMLTDLSLNCEENSCGYCDFTIYPDHPLYSIIRERDADNPIKVYDNDILLFVGFIYELGKEFYLDGHVKCKGELDYLSESIVHPYSTTTKYFHTKVPDNLEGLFNWFIKQHNSQVGDNKKFRIGKNQAARFDISEALDISNNSYPNTISEISDQILKKIGGYLNLRYDDHGIRYLDYLYEWEGLNTQLLDFGVNLTSYTQTDDSSEIASYIIPMGAKLSDTDYTSENNNSDWDNLPLLLNTEPLYGSTTSKPNIISTNITSDIKVLDDKIYSKSAVERYGWIGKTYSNTDAKNKQSLVEMGTKALKEWLQPKRTIEVKAVDMHLINPNIKPIRIGEYVRVRSKPHGLDSYFICRNIELDLNNPENSIYSFGTTYDSFTGEQNKTINALNATIRKQFETIDIISESEKQTAATAEEVKNQFDNLEIGGINLLLGTRDFDGANWHNIEYWETWDVNKYFGYREYGKSGISIGQGIYQKVSVKKDHIYTFSFYALGDENTNVIVNIKDPNRDMQITDHDSIEIGKITESYERYHVTFRATDDGYICPRVENTTDSWIKIYALKFELGTMPTDWSPAPSDLESVVAEQDDAICALYEENLAYQAETDDAICELYELVSGGE